MAKRIRTTCDRTNTQLRCSVRVEPGGAVVKWLGLACIKCAVVLSNLTQPDTHAVVTKHVPLGQRQVPLGRLARAYP